MPEPILRAQRFTYAYPDAASPALADVSLELEPGELCLVCGESGSGKSTLVRAACGLVPHFHGGEAAGDLSVGGLSVRDNGPSELAAVCGTLLQDPEAQVVMSGVRAEIALPLEHRGEPPAAVARAVEEVALALGIGALLDRRTETLSGGELQRVALAAALVTRPRMLLLDEPTSQLDPVAGDDLMSLLRRLNDDWGTTVVLAEHRIDRCLPAADRVVALAGGRVACDAAPREFLRWAADRVPALLPPAARLFSLAGLSPPPASVKEARTALARASLVPPVAPATDETGAAPARVDGARSAGPLARLRAGRRDPPPPPALAFHGVWHELDEGPAILREVDLEIRPGERVALMGRNGAGKSTLLRHARGLADPTRGRVERAGRVALLLQSPGDYLIHDRCADEVGPPGAGCGRPGRAGVERPARPVRRRAPAARARSGAGGRGAARGGMPRRAHAGHGPAAKARAGAPP